jgi:hypothetical protein
MVVFPPQTARLTSFNVISSINIYFFRTFEPKCAMLLSIIIIYSQ